MYKGLSLRSFADSAGKKKQSLPGCWYQFRLLLARLMASGVRGSIPSIVRRWMDPAFVPLSTMCVTVE